MNIFKITIAHRRDKAPIQVISIESDNLLIARLDAVTLYAKQNNLPAYKAGTRQSVYFSQFNVIDVLTISAALFNDGWTILVNQSPIGDALSHADAHRIAATCNTRDDVLAAVAAIGKP